MKRRLSFLFVSLLFILGLASCGSNNNAGDYSETTEFYLDEAVIARNNLEFSYTASTKQYQANNYYDLNVEIDIKNSNKDYEVIEYNSAYIVDEGTSDKYEAVSNLMFDDGTLIIGEETKIKFTAQVTNDFTEYNYYFTIIIDDHLYIIHLYETPSIYRTDYKITYYVDNVEVNSITVKQGSVFPKGYNYVWEDKEHYYYCDIWYFESDLSRDSILEDDITITKDYNFYGRKINCLDFQTTTSDEYAYITNIAYVHKDGNLLIQPSYNSKDICISRAAIVELYDLKVLYLPKTLRVIYEGNFVNTGLTTVYYEGTVEEWTQIDHRSVLPSDVSIICEHSFYDDYIE